ncbi:MAG: mandelate racemase/muconate lactonizing enzyme family protein [Myxococcota bacterium]
MKITHVEVWKRTFRLRTGYAVAYGNFDTAENVFVRIHSSRGKSGLGCAAPDPQVTGETADDVETVLRREAIPRIVGRDPLRLALRMQQLARPLAAFPSARAAVDMALHDHLGIVADLPLYKLLGGYRHKMKTSVTVGILPLEQTVSAAKGLCEQGFRALKLKGGLDADADAARVLAVRRAVGARIELRFDANQGYSADQAVAFVERTRDAKVSLIEQPTPADQLDLLGRVTRRVPIPVMADESLVTLRDAFRLARRGLVDMVNVKLMKVGGIAEALAVNAVARAADVQVMVGCMDEATVSIAAGLHFALSRPNVTFADLDGHLDLVDDPTSGAVLVKDGVLIPNAKAGLGCLDLARSGAVDT